MKYQTTSDLPETLQSTLPTDAQQIYIDAYNNALADESATPGGELSHESAAHTLAWHAVQEEFEQNEKTGEWYRKGEGPVDDDADEGLIDKLKNLF